MAECASKRHAIPPAALPLSEERYRSAVINSNSAITDQTEKLASIGQVIAGVAHELNNPLSAILLFAEDLLQVDRPADEAEALTIIAQQARRSRAIVRDLLSFVRSREITRAAVGPRELLDKISRTLRPQTTELGVALHVDVSGLELIHVDPAGIEQVITNLVMNGAQATGAGGNVWMRCYGEPGGYVIEVLDDGPGIPEDVLARIFQPFFTTKPMGQGTGLGLSVSVGIVERHGGTIGAENVDPRNGHGARFVVHLPSPAKSHSVDPTGEAGDSILVA